jgi:predicted outer membrane repeat protein
MSKISHTLDIHSLNISSNSVSLNGGAILFLTTLIFTLFHVASFKSQDQVSILSFLRISIL